MTPLERHKSRIKAAIKANASRNNAREYKPERKWKHRYSVKKYSGRYLPHEQSP